jgi:hypothetical protein
LSLDPRFEGLNLAEDYGFLKAIKIRIATFFGGEVKPSVLCCRFYSMIKKLRSMKDILHRKNSRSFLAKILLLRYQMSLLVTSKELWWVNQE